MTNNVFVKRRGPAVWGLIVSIIAVFVTGTAIASEPSAKQISSAFSFDVPPVWDVKDFNVEATQNFGTNVEPLYKSRFNATLEVKDDTFEPIGRVGNTTVLRQVLRTAYSVKVYGVSSATLNQGQWVFRFELQGSPFRQAGMPRGAFQGHTVIQGSAEFYALQAELDRQRQAAIDAERQRKQAALEAQQAARAAADVRRTAIRAQIAGTWESVGPVVDADGDILSDGRDGSWRYRVEIPSDGALSSPITVTVFDVPVLGHSKSVSASLTIGDEGAITWSESEGRLDSRGGGTSYSWQFGSKWSAVRQGNELLITRASDPFGNRGPAYKQTARLHRKDKTGK